MKEVAVGEEEGAPNIGDAVISKQGKSSKYVCDLYDSKKGNKYQEYGSLQSEVDIY